MRRRQLTIFATTLLLPGCGHHFPFGERLLLFTYGPPYGAALRENLPHHPHNPAAGEREAEPEPTENLHYKTYARCRAALAEALARKQVGATAVDVSPREAVGHAQEGEVIHEYRCVGPELSYRAWRHGGAEPGAAEDGEEHH